MNPFTKSYLVLAFFAVLSTLLTPLALNIITDSLVPSITPIDFITNGTRILLAIGLVFFTCALYFLAVKSIIVEVRDQAVFKKMRNAQIHLSESPLRAATPTNPTRRRQPRLRRTDHWLDDDYN